MCLDKITKETPAKEAYKIFRKTDKQNELRDMMCTEQRRTIGKWYYAQPWWRRLLHTEKEIAASCYHPYEAGFHAYNNLDEAKRYVISTRSLYPVDILVIAKVLLAEPICVGSQDGYTVTVARKMKIIEIVG